MSSIDDRVVNMQFNNAQFQQGISETNKSLNDLKDNLKLDGATSGLDQIQAASSRFSLAGIEDALQNVTTHFSLFGAVGFTIIQDLTNTALSAGVAMANALVGPLVQGGAQRALALQQAKFQFQGLGLDVTSTMNAALAAVKGTAFGLDDAATAAAQFGASGINATNGLEVVLRSVAGVAAQTGSSYSSVAQIFESVAGNGRLMGQDLLQLSARGVNAAAVLAKSMGISEESVRTMVSKGKISFKQFSDAMNVAFGANAANANQTYSGALDNMHAALARIGADVASPYFLGMRDIFNALGPLFDTIHTALGPVLADFADLQAASAAGIVAGINQINDGIANFMGSGFGAALKNILDIAKIIGGALKSAFAEIFPPEDGLQLWLMVDGFWKLTERLIPGEKAIAEFKRTFAGFFAIIDLGLQVVFDLGDMIANLLGYTLQGSGGFLDFTAKVGDWLVKLDQATKKGGELTKFFQVLGGYIAMPIAFLKTFFGIIADGVVDLSHLKADGIKKFADDVAARFQGLNQLGQFFVSFWSGVVKVVTAIFDFLNPIFHNIAVAITKAVDNVKSSVKGLNFDDALKALNTGIFAAFILIVKGFFGNLGGVLQGNGVAIVSSFKKVFGQLQLNLKALEMNTNAKTLETIAISVALLAASAVALSLVDSAKLALALGAIGGMMKGLIVTFEAFSKIGGAKGLLETAALVLAIQGIATAILILAGAIAILGALPLDNLIKGVLGVVAVLIALTVVMKKLADSGPEILFAAGAIAIIAPAMAIMAGAIAILGALPLNNLVQGMAAFTIVLVEMTLALGAMADAGPSVLMAAGAIALIAPAMATLVGVVALLGTLSLNDLIQGLVGLSAALVIMGFATVAMEGDIAGAAAMVVAAAAITILAGALKIVATMSWDDIGRSMVVLAGSLAILAGAMALMGIPLVLLGAVGILAAAGALAILAPAMVLLGTISWDAIGRGLTVLGAALAILAVGGVLLIPAAVGFTIFGVAMLLIGTGVLAAATGISMLAIAVTALVAVGAGGIALFTMGIKAFIGQLPAFGAGIGEAIVSMATVIGKDAPKLIVAFVAVLVAMLDAIGVVIPKIVTTATKLVITFVNAIVVLVPLLANAGLTIVQGVLTAVAKHIGEIAKQGVLIVAHFIDGISAGLPTLVQSGINLVINFINSLANGIKQNQSRMSAAGRNLAMAIADGMTGGLASKVGSVIAAAQRLVANIPSAIKTLLHINSPSKVTTEIGEFTGEGVAVGLDNKTGRVSSSANALGQAAIEGVKSSIAGISDAMKEGIDNTPSIRPVIDTSGIKDGAAKINSMLQGPTLSLNSSTDVATSVALQEQAKNAQLVRDASNIDPSTGKQLVFNQYNNSPKALSTTEIYRQTQNQLSTLKGELGVVDQSPANE